jgi:hypothetical protein
MSRINLDDNRTYGMTLGPKTKFANEQAIQTTGQVIDVGSPPVIFLTPAGAINLLLPPSSGVGAAAKGQVFIFVNLSGNVVTLQTSAGGAFTTAVTVAANGATRVICTGSAVAGLGWVVW